MSCNVTCKVGSSNDKQGEVSILSGCHAESSGYCSVSLQVHSSTLQEFLDRQDGNESCRCPADRHDSAKVIEGGGGDGDGGSELCQWLRELCYFAAALGPTIRQDDAKVFLPSFRNTQHAPLFNTLCF